MSAQADQLRARVAALFSNIDATIEDSVFDGLACDVFAFQFEHCAPYRAYCERRGVTPGSVTRWSDVPAVPTAAFKEVPLVAGQPRDADLVFRTSGTTTGIERRGAHYVLDAELYRQSLLPTFQAFVLPDAPRMRILSLVPPFVPARSSSLSYMVETVMAACGADGSGWFIDAEHGMDVAALSAAMEDAIAAAQPVCILATSLAMVHLVEALETRDRRFSLAPGSRIMDTGGYKGRQRSIPADALREHYVERFGLDPRFCVNEYGMTEMLSQFYDGGLRTHLLRRRGEPGIKQGPPWVRSRAVDPETLAPVPDGEPGILQHFDLANLFSVSSLQTEDLGRVHGHGLELLGRLPGATPRGCSIAMDILLDRPHE